MSFDVIDVDNLTVESGGMSWLKGLTLHERMLVQLYRQVGESEQLLVMRMLEALIAAVPPS